MAARRWKKKTAENKPAENGSSVTTEEPPAELAGDSENAGDEYAETVAKELVENAGAADPRITQEMCKLECELTPEERVDRAIEAERLFAEAASVDAEAKAASKAAKEKHGGLISDGSYNLRCASKGVEYREVECEIVQDFGAGTHIVTRLDTGVEIESRTLDDWERQMEIGEDEDESPPDGGWKKDEGEDTGDSEPVDADEQAPENAEDSGTA